MDLIATRELARIQSVLNLLRMQRAELSELSDIHAFRSLEETYRDALEEAQKLGKAPADPVAEVQADWRRLIRWSNQVQAALREADELGEELKAAGAPTEKRIRKQKRADAPGKSGLTELFVTLRDHLSSGGSEASAKPRLAELRSLEQELKEAPARLENLLVKARAEIKQSDWQGNLPYAELTDVADAMGWDEAVELAEAPGKWTEGVSLRARPLLASRLALEPGSAMYGKRLSELGRKSIEIRDLIEKHAAHSTTLAEVTRLTEAGAVDTARRTLSALEPAFGDLDYAGSEHRLAVLEKQLADHGQKISKAVLELKALGAKAKGFFAFAPLALNGQCKEALRRAEALARETAALAQTGGESEFNRRVRSLQNSLAEAVATFRTTALDRLSRWIMGTAAAWVVFLAVAGVTFQQIQARQERERQRVAAEAKAGEERALSEAKMRSEAEEKERQRLAAIAEQERLRLAAEAKAKMEAAETAIGMKLELSRPFGPGLRGVVGEIVVRWIPSGRFTMGSPSSEEGRDSDETQHEVVLSHGFFMAETECTQGQWEMVMGSNPSHFKGRDRPVEKVSWGEAVEYCRKLTLKQLEEGVLPEGWEWRLPTESEWEYAARAGTTGARHGELDAIAWHAGNSGGETHPVKGKQANAWGLHDMIGNVWEWCEDWADGYPTGSVTDPTGPSSGSVRVIRGGGWNFIASLARSAERNGFGPGDRYNLLGFRPALRSVR